MFDYKNTNIRLVLINITVFVLAFLLNDPFHVFESDYTTAPSLLPFKNISDIDEIITSGNEDKSSAEILFTKKNNSWYVESMGKKYLADSSKIDRALTGLLSLKKYYEVTDNKEKYKDFGVEDNDFQLVLKGKKKNSVLIIGSPGAAYNTNMVRIKSEKKAYSVKGSLKSDWNQNIDYFRNKRLLKIDKENIARIDLKGPVIYSLVNNSNKWALVNANQTLEANPPRVERLIGDLVLMEGLNFFTGEYPGIPYGNISVNLKSNIAFNIEIRKQGKDFLIKSDYNPYWQIVSEYRIKALFPEFKEIIAPQGNQ